MLEEQGAGDGIGTTVNCPLGHGASGVDVRQAFAGKLAPALRSFEPQLIMISAGFDAHVEDPMASFERPAARGESTAVTGSG